MKTSMNIKCASALCMAGALAGPNMGIPKALGQAPGWNGYEQGVQVLTRGPVHEAFAETVSFDPQPGLIVPNAPPAPIAELPPEQRLEGGNVTWIPGYWAWDDEQRGFIWISGIWRAMPPERQWMAGYWGQSGQGAQWTSGYWASANAVQTRYLPPPPETVEVGANIPAPSPDSSWVPGCWVWTQGQYAWRPGYWVLVQPNWVWIPAHYVYTPRGYVFVSGYWDFDIARRGVLFAPVQFEPQVYAQPGFAYSPTTVINLAVFSDQLFVRPSYNHYYFGDYYAATFQDAGFFASFTYHSGHRGYEPIYAHQRWENRQDRDWDFRLRAEFSRRRDHEDARPARTLASGIRRSRDTDGSRGRDLVVGDSIDRVARRSDTPLRFQPLQQQERQQLLQRGQDVQKFRTERQKLETTTDVPAVERASRESRPAKLKLPRSPIVGRSAAQLDKDQAPPRKPQVPRVDPTVQPRERIRRNTQQ